MSDRRVVQLLARYRVANLDEFVERHAADLASSGFFVRTESPLPVGSYVELECRGEDDEPLLSALGRVVRVRTDSDASTGHPAGMVLQFLRVDKATQRALEMGERSSRFGMRVDADDRSWSDQQRVTPALSTPPPSMATVQNARIEVRVDASMAPPATEVERTPPLFAALLGGDSSALRPGRVPAGFEGLYRPSSEPDTGDAAPLVTPRSAIARPFGATTPELGVLEAVQLHAPPSVPPPSAGPLSRGDTMPLRLAASELPPPSSITAVNALPEIAGIPEPTPEPEPMSEPAPMPSPPARRPVKGAAVALWIALAIVAAGAFWVSTWLAAADGPAASETPAARP
jgi:hypothetical protein